MYQREWKMKNKLQTFLLALSFILFALGWNTIDYMMWSFRWDPFWLTTRLWDMGPFWMDQWWCYFLFGILPFALGSFIFGFHIHEMLEKKE